MTDGDTAPSAVPWEVYARAVDALREHAIMFGCLCEWDNNGNPVDGKHRPQCWSYPKEVAAVLGEAERLSMGEVDDGVLVENVRLVHGRDTCDEAGRPLDVYVCDYHQGFRDAIDEATGKDASDG